MNKPTRLQIEYKGEARILAIPDLHLPFADFKALDQVIRFAEENKPTHIVHVGDLYDMYSFSRFAKSLNLITPEQEMDQARLLASVMWEELRKASPKALCYQLRGNHEERLYKFVLDKAPALEAPMREFIDNLTKFKGVVGLKSFRDELVINGIAFVHGWTKAGSHMRYLLEPVVHGHDHRGYYHTMPVRGKMLFELSCGHLADEDSLPLVYRDTKTTQWVKGFGYIEGRNGRFVGV